MSGGPFLNIILSASASHPPLERAPELVQVVVVVPGDHGEELVDAPATAGVRVDAGAVPQSPPSSQRRNWSVSSRRREKASSAAPASLRRYCRSSARS